MLSSRAVARINADEVLSPTSPVKAGRVGAIRLSTVDDIRVEMARVYRQARRGQIATEEMTRFVYALSQMARVYELSVLEQRIKQLELDHGTS